MNEKVIWDFLNSKLKNQYGTAALMGNLYVESHLDPHKLQGSYVKKLKMTGDEYTAAVDNGTYSREEFQKDSAGYGLAQWTYWSRKDALWRYAKSSNTSIGDLNTQLNYLWEELQGYKTVLNALLNATNIREASDVVVKRYEKPAKQTEELMQNRANFGQEYYNQFAVKQEEQKNKKPTKVVAKVDVNLRVGNGKNYCRLAVLNAGQSLPYVCSADNGWHAVDHKADVLWVMDEFVELVYE